MSAVSEIPGKRRRRRRLWYLVPVGLVLMVAGAVWTLGRAPVDVPVWVMSRIEARLDSALEQLGLEATIGQAQVDLRDLLVPSVRLEDLSVTDAQGTHLDLDRMDAVLSRDDLLAGKLVPRALRISGLSLAARTDANGQFSLSLGQERVADRIESLPQFLSRIRAILDAPGLAAVRELGVEDLTLQYSDDRSGAEVTTKDGSLRISRQGEKVSLDLALLLDQIEGTAGNSGGRAAVYLSSDGPQGPAEARASLSGIVPARVARIVHSAPLAELLSRLDAPVGFEVEAERRIGGAIGALRGRISIGEGSVALTTSDTPVALRAVDALVELSTDGHRMDLTELYVDAEGLQLNGYASVLAEPGPGGQLLQPDTPLAVQVVLDNLTVDPPRVFSSPQSFDFVHADLRLLRGERRVDVSTMTLGRGDLRIALDGQISRDDGAAVNVAIEEIAPAQLVALWPQSVLDKTRLWIGKNIEAGTMRRVRASARLAPGAAPKLGVSFAIDGGQVRPIRRLEPIRNATGEATVDGTVFSVRLEEAEMDVPGVGSVKMRDGLVRLPDIREKNGTLEVSFNATSSTEELLALLASPGLRPPDAPPPTGKPFLPPDDAAGDIDLNAEIYIPLRVTTRFKNVDFAVEGTARNFATTSILPGRALTAERMTVKAGPREMEVTGEMALDGEAMQVGYTRIIAPEAEDKGASRITASGAMTPELLAGFGVKLGPGALRGKGKLSAQVDTAPGVKPKLAVTGDLSGMAVSVPAVGLSKSARSGGEVALSGTLGDGGRLDKISIRAPGLTVDGSAAFAPGGSGVSALQFDRAKIAGWIDVAARMVPGKGLTLTGGSVDLRNRPESGNSGGGGSGPPLSVSLDKVVLNDGISLTGVRGSLSAGGSGEFTAKINGGTPVKVSLSQQNSGLAIRVQSSDAGGVLRSAGLMKQVRGGTLDLRLTPEGGKGRYKGQLRVKRIALRNTPVLAEIIAGISLVGAVEQMAGEGITFDDVRADFRLRPDRVIIDASSAVGNSLGLSLDGVVDLNRDVVDLQGVVSPVYFLNQAGSFMTRRGEGLVGVSYRLTGPLTGPKVRVNPLSVLTPGFLRDIFRVQPKVKP